MSVTFFPFLIALTLFGFVSCQSTPQERSRAAGHKISRLLIQDLKRVKRRDDLLTVKPDLERHFAELGEALLKARAHSALAPMELSQEDHTLSEDLREEINRVSQIEGGRQVICAAQKPIWDLLEKE